MYNDYIAILLNIFM